MNHKIQQLLDLGLKLTPFCAHPVFSSSFGSASTTPAGHKYNTAADHPVICKV
jgi:hypothetical protein